MIDARMQQRAMSHIGTIRPCLAGIHPRPLPNTPTGSARFAGAFAGPAQGIIAEHVRPVTNRRIKDKNCYKYGKHRGMIALARPTQMHQP